MAQRRDPRLGRPEAFDMLSCQDLSGFLCDLVSGQLAAEIKEEVEEHLRGCPRCRSELEQYRQVIDLARQLPALPPPHRLLERYRAAVQGAGEATGADEAPPPGPGTDPATGEGPPG
jgi:anti-sigma factor RsiW